jgi:signal transduction histidine kinase
MAKNDLKAQLSRYKKLISISQDLASMLDLDILLRRIVQAATDLTKAESASILLYDGRLEQLYFQVASKAADPLLRGLKVPVENSIAGWIVVNRKPIIINDVSKDERFYGEIGEQTGLITKSLLGVPLIAKNKVNGVLEAINKKDGQFTDQDQDALMTLGTQAAVAIENSRLFQQFDLIAEFIHEIRTPLASLNTATHLLTHPEIDDAKRDKLAESIQRETNRLNNMSTDFLSVARLESGRSQFQIETIKLPTLLEECTQLMKGQAEQNGLIFEYNYPDNLPVIEGDRDKLKQSIINLLSNAIKYNHPGGKVSLEAEATSEGIYIHIKDTGIGIPEKYMEKLFSKFFRVPGSESYAHGTGLGLSIVKRIIEGHGGNIEVQSEVDTGTTFSIFLPK